MKFKIGDILVSKYFESNDITIIGVCPSVSLYHIKFVYNNIEYSYYWTFEKTYNGYELKVPNHIPKEQHERYKKLKESVDKL